MAFKACFAACLVPEHHACPTLRPANDNRPRRSGPAQPGNAEPASLGTPQLALIALAVLALIAGVVWMVDGMQKLSRDEVCFESHARNCQPVDKGTP